MNFGFSLMFWLSFSVFRFIIIANGGEAMNRRRQLDGGMRSGERLSACAHVHPPFAPSIILSARIPLNHFHFHF